MENFKYFGILKDFDTEKITMQKLDILVKIGLFDCFESFHNDNFFENEDDYMALCDTYYTDEKEYYLKKEIYEEMFNFRNQYLKQRWAVEPVYYEIDEAITTEFLEENKINAINKKYDQYLKIVKNIRIYNLYKNNCEINGFGSWFEYFEDNIGENDRYVSLEKYLKGNSNYLPSKFQDEWNNCYTFLKISDYCELKKNQLLNIKTNNMEWFNENEDQQIDFTKPSVPKSIAMLKVTGFFELENIKKLNSSKLYKIVAVTIGLDPNNNTHIRSIRGNINVLNNKSEENLLKFTASNHINDMMKLLQ